MMTRSIFAIVSLATGSTFAYCGFMALNINPGVPLGLGMMFVGAAVALIGPIISFIR